MGKMVPPDNGTLMLIPAIYSDFVEVVSKAIIETAPPHWSIVHANDFDPSFNYCYEWILY